MPTPTVDWNLDTNSRTPAPRKLLRAADGDTPFIEQPIRMVSVDTPEKAGYAGGALAAQPKLDQCRQRLENGFYDAIPKKTRTYLIGKLGPNAAADHISAGVEASNVFDHMVATRLTKPDGKMRSIGIIPTGEVIDRYGRMLAYIVPWFAGTSGDPVPPKDDPRRNTFNLDMIATGWGAFFPVYGSLPAADDMNKAIAAAEAAWHGRKGIWEVHSRKVLLAYEYRLCIKLGTATSASKGIKDAFQRVCVDLRTKKDLGLFGFAAVPPPYRMWVWQDQEAEAIVRLGLKVPPA